MPNHTAYMRRCFELARRADLDIKSNPPVGAVLVHDNEIIGEGWHKKYGEDHAEVVCLKSVQKRDISRIKEATLYVSLEPCFHHGKTPPCVNLILEKKIQKVIISCQDPTPKVGGKSIQLLKSKGVQVITDVLASQGQQLIRPFYINHTKDRPFVTIKFAKSSDNFIGKVGKQVWLSNSYSRILAHKLRAENDGILVGSNTILADNPTLTTRLFSGASPLRTVLDPTAKTLGDFTIWTDSNNTLLVTDINTSNLNTPKNVLKVNYKDGLKPILKSIYNQGVTKLLVEGGAQTISHFLSENLWDRAFIINTSSKLYDGIKAPNIEGRLLSKMELNRDIILEIENSKVKNS